MFVLHAVAPNAPKVIYKIGKYQRFISTVEYYRMQMFSVQRPCACVDLHIQTPCIDSRLQVYSYSRDHGHCVSRLSYLRVHRLLFRHYQLNSSVSFLFSFLFLAQVSSLPCPAAATERNGRVVGGTSSERNQMPFIVSLRRRGGHFCGASILNERWLLTAGHCVCK